MSNDFYNPTSAPSTGASLSSATMRAEYVLVAAGFDKLPTLSGNGGKFVRVNSGGTALEASSSLSIASGKTLTVSNTLTLAGTDGKTLTVSNSLTLAGTDGKTLTVNNNLTLGGTDGKSLTLNNNLTVSNSLTLAGTDGKTLTVNKNLTLDGTDGKTLTLSNSLTLAGTDGTTMTFPSSSASVAALNLEDQTLAGGARVTSKSLSAGNITLDPGDRPLQYISNTGAFTITAPANDGSLLLLITNGVGAGAVSWSGFQVGSNTGDAFTTTNGDDFLVSIARINGISTYHIKALQ